VVALLNVVLDDGLDLVLEVASQGLVFEQDAVFQGLVPALDLALCLGMTWGTADMAHIPGLDVF
jgi:hypothetical protein